MGTRGLSGFHVDGKDYLSYQQYDSYPEGVGLQVVEALRELLAKYGVDGLKDKVRAIRLVNASMEPTRVEREQYKVLHERVSTGVDWYAQLRSLQGRVDLMVEHGIMTDDATFARNSLFCEWAYCINLDTQMLEVYKGFQTSEGEGRFAGRSIHGDKYGGITLFVEYPFDKIPEGDAFCDEINVLQDVDDVGREED